MVRQRVEILKASVLKFKESTADGTFLPLGDSSVSRGLLTRYTSLSLSVVEDSHTRLMKGPVLQGNLRGTGARKIGTTAGKCDWIGEIGTECSRGGVWMGKGRDRLGCVVSLPASVGCIETFIEPIPLIGPGEPRMHVGPRRIPL